MIAILLLTFSCEQTPQFLFPIPTLVAEAGFINGYDLATYKRDPAQVITVEPSDHFRVSFRAGVDSLYIDALPGAPELGTIAMTIDGQSRLLLVRTLPTVRHTFTYRPDSTTELVVVMGAFNDWSRTALPLFDRARDGTLERTVYLRPRRHEYKFVIDGREAIDPANPVSVSNNIGGWNSVLDLSAYGAAPGGYFLKQSAGGHRLTFTYQALVAGSLPGHTIVLLDNRELAPERVAMDTSGSVSIDIAGLPDGRLRLTGTDRAGRAIRENVTLLRGEAPLDPATSPADWHFTVLYSLMVDRFLDGDATNTRRAHDADIVPLADFHGGDLAGITAKLRDGYFNDLGISALWISPLSRQPDSGFVESIPPHRKFTGYHGYWPVAAREVDPRFGTGAGLKTLVQEAHRRDIKVILDFVSNHTHQEHPYVTKYPEWFGSFYLPDSTVNLRRWGEETRLTTWFDSFLPSFDYPGAPQAEDQMVADAIWWLDTFDFDGFRQDAVKHVPHTFWRKLTAAMRRLDAGRDWYQIGETFGSDALIGSYVNPAELSSQFNFSVYFPARTMFAHDEADFAPLVRILDENMAAYGPVNLMGTLTSSHDQGRFVGFADGQVSFAENGTERAFTAPPHDQPKPASYAKLSNFTAFNMALPGVPVIYYGEEIGMLGAADPDNRRPMRFGSDLAQDEQALLQAVASAVKLRGQYPALALGDLELLVAEGPTLVLAKWYFDETILLTINHSREQRDIEFSLPAAVAELVDLLDHQRIEVRGGAVSLTMEPYSTGFWLAAKQGGAVAPE